MNAAELPAYDGNYDRQAAHSRFLARLCRPARSATTLPGKAPTAAGLERHAARFGPEQVANTAAEYGLGVALESGERKPKQPRLRGMGLRARVREHLAAGKSVELIAELENITPGRARRYANKIGATS